ncbi:macrophage stimulating 1 receptor (c-met-tyrosine kinase), variant 2 [Chamberlinius hualienensis]
MNYYVNAKVVKVVKEKSEVVELSKEEEKTLAILKKEGLYVYRGFLHLGLIIGRGFFGKVRLATLHLPLPTKVAVKSMINDGQLKSRKEIWSLLREVFCMKDLDHVNILTVIAVSINSKGYPMVITPFMANGDLHSYISHENHLVTVRQLLTFGHQIGKGMDYLEANRIIHRDLATRNCLLDEDFVVKIGDFGLARSLNKCDQSYYVSQQKSTPMPIRWMAPESIKNSKYNHKSDVVIAIWNFQS